MKKVELKKNLPRIFFIFTPVFELPLKTQTSLEELRVEDLGGCRGSVISTCLPYLKLVRFLFHDYINPGPF